MNHCVDCLHWDEDKADEQGYALCQHPVSSYIVRQESVSAAPFRKLRVLVSGDDSCEQFTAKLATPRQSDEPVRE